MKKNMCIHEASPSAVMTAGIRSWTLDFFMDQTRPQVKD